MRFRQHLDLLMKIETSEIKCFNVPWSCMVFLESLDVSRMLPGTPGHDVMKSFLGILMICDVFCANVKWSFVKSRGARCLP